MQAVLLAGGLGTRLRSVVNDRPKPMADVAGKPFMEYLLLELKKHGIDQIVMAVGFKGSMVEEYFGNGNQLGVDIKYSYEETQLGTAGAIKNAEPYITEEKFFVLNADTFYRASYEEVLRLDHQNDFEMTLVLRKVPDVSRYGSVKTSHHQITGFNEKVNEHIAGVINGGIYYMKKSVLEVIPSAVKCSLENEIIPMLLKQNRRIGAVVNEGYFIDIGVPDDYYQFIEDVKSGKLLF